ncbi:hypothetical protein HBI80_233230 [Parastagonospora nodorum]|nr:hypothetical protein HBI06_222210 [Parastagonospora nodorum]KAH4226144.1 hypothetical protein HBI05_223880 [Parastagonospora nodorum]KAH4358183.1 hypothetical protein HBH97_218840 [Parastagonospora nodorum]KAH4372382.1 hypothetical protein HBH99_230510 [Parastagonospora nodorum]KAH4892796.1 hypothetical protein HBH74_204330 [Parastagonospora nodorum]
MPKARPVQLPIADRMAYITLTPCFDIGTEDAGLSTTHTSNTVKNEAAWLRVLVASQHALLQLASRFMFLLASSAYTRKRLTLLIPTAIFRRAKNVVIVETNASPYDRTFSMPRCQSIGKSLAFCRSPWPPVIVGSRHHSRLIARRLHPGMS